VASNIRPLATAAVISGFEVDEVSASEDDLVVIGSAPAGRFDFSTSRSNRIRSMAQGMLKKRKFNGMWASQKLLKPKRTGLQRPATHRTRSSSFFELSCFVLQFSYSCSKLPCMLQSSLHATTRSGLLDQSRTIGKSCSFLTPALGSPATCKCSPRRRIVAAGESLWWTFYRELGRLLKSAYRVFQPQRLSGLPSNLSWTT
jgi:hypothetical protein